MIRINMIRSLFAAGSNKNRLSFVIDIDGVLIKSRKPIPRAKEGMELIQKHKIPFVLFTNNLSKSEEFKAQEITNYLSLQTPITGEQVVLNYTPIKKFTDWVDKLVLIVARPEVEEILPISEITRYITINEYVSLFPQTVPFPTKGTNNSKETMERVCKRLQKESLNIHELKFDVVFVLCVPIKWEESIQVIIDLLSTQNGQVSKEKSFHAPSSHIPIYSSFDDLLLRREEHNLPRFLMRPFLVSLQAVYKEIYHQQLEITSFGKPNRKAFEFVHNHIDGLFGKSDNYVMIGDNEDVDIKGASEYGWNSVLVLSGVSVEESKKATRTCSNIQEAVKWAIKEAGFPQ